MASNRQFGRLIQGCLLVAVMLGHGTALAGEVTHSSLTQRHAKFDSLETTNATAGVTLVDEDVAARDFGIDKPGYERYRELMRGVGRFGWPNQNPLFILGVYARDTAEQKKYALLLAKYEQHRNQALFDFNRVYVQAGTEACPGCQLFDADKVTDPSQQVAAPLEKAKEDPLAQPKKGDQVVFFTRLNCIECDYRFQRAYGRTKNLTTLQVYLQHATADDIKKWAQSQQLTLDDIEQKRVALHMETNERTLFNANDGEAFTLRNQAAYQLSLDSPFASNEPQWTPPQ